MSIRAIYIPPPPPPPKVDETSGVDRLAALRAEAKRLQEELRLAREAEEARKAAALAEKLAKTKAELRRLDPPPEPAGPKEPETLSLTNGTGSGANEPVTAMPLSLRLPVMDGPTIGAPALYLGPSGSEVSSPVVTAPVRYQTAPTDAPANGNGNAAAEADAGAIVDDVEAGKSIELIAQERGLTRDEVIAKLKAGGYSVTSTENSDARATEIRDPETGKTVTENYDFQHGSYYTAVETAGGHETTPIRDERGWKMEEDYDPETGITKTRYEDDLGSGTVVEKTELPSGVVIAITTQPDGNSQTVVTTPDGKETTLADGQEPTREGAEDIINAVEDGKSIDEIASEQGLTHDQVVAQLAAAGIDVKTTEPTSDNGDVETIELVDAETGDRVAVYYHDYQHDAVTVQYTDGDGNDVRSTEYSDGKTVETVTDKDGRKTTTTTEPVNGGDPVEHTVKDNESLIGIAEQYGVTLQDLQEDNPQYFKDGRDPNVIHPGETVVVEDGTKTTVSVTFNGHTLTTGPDGKMTFTDASTGTEIDIKPGSVDEALARTLLAANPQSSNPQEAKEGEIVVAAVESLLAGQSYQQLLDAAGDRREETQEAIDKYGIGPTATPVVEVDESGNQIINFQGTAPTEPTPSGEPWVPVKVDGSWHWVDQHVAEAIFAENTALARVSEAQALFDRNQKQLDVWALDPTYKNAMDGAVTTLDETLGAHGLRWVKPKPEGTLADAKNRLNNANTRLEEAGGALDAYENAENVLGDALTKQADLPVLSDPDQPSYSAPGDTGNPHVEFAEGTADYAEVAALFYQADYQRSRGDKLSVDFTVHQLQDQMDGLDKGSKTYKELKAALDQAQDLQKALGSQLKIAEAYANFYNAKSDLSDILAQAEGIKTRLLDEYNDEHSFLFEKGKKHQTVGGDYLGLFQSQEVVERDGQLWVINHFDEGDTEQQLTYSLNDDNVNEDYRDRALNQEWQHLLSGDADENVCAANALGTFKSAELNAGKTLNETLEQELGVKIEDLDAQIDQLQDELAELNTPESYAEPPQLPDGVEPVSIKVGDQTIEVAPEVAENYNEVGLQALEDDGRPVRIQIDTDGDGSVEWQWVDSKLAFASIALNLAQDQRTAAEDTRSSAHAAANWYGFQLTQPLKLMDDGETAEHNARLQDAYLEEHEGQMLDERVRPQIQKLYEGGYNDIRALNDADLVDALSLDVNSDKGRETLDAVKDEMRDIGGDEAQFRIVPVFYVDETVGMQQTALFAVKDDEGKTWYVDATGKKFDSVEDFQDNNQQFRENGHLILPTDLRLEPGQDGTIDLDVVKARNVSTWDKIADPLIGIGSGLAGLAALIPTPASPFLAGLAYTGAAYLGAKTAYNQFNHIQHGGEWNDKQSLMNMGMIATTVLPGASSGLRTFGMMGRTIGQTGARITCGQAFLASIGAVKPNSVLATAAGTYMKDSGVLNRLARGADWSSIGIGAPMIAVSVHDLAAHGDQMSGLEKANALLGVGTGLIGTGLGSGALITMKPAKAPAKRETIALTDHAGNPFDAQIIGPPPQDADRIYIPRAGTEMDPRASVGKTHIAVADPKTGEMVVIPWHNDGLNARLFAQGDDPVHDWSGNDLSSLSSNDVPLIEVVSFASFDKQQLRAFTSLQIKRFRRSQVRAIPADRIQYLDVSAFNPKQIRWLSKDQIAGLTRRQLRDISNARLQAHFTKAQIRSIPPTNIQSLRLDGITSKQMPWFTHDQVANFSTRQLGELSDAYLHVYMTKDQFAAIPAKNFNHLDMKGLTGKQVKWFTGDQAAKLSLTQLQNLAENNLIRHFNESQLAAVSGEHLKHLDIADVIEPKQVPWLTRGQVRRLTGTQLEEMADKGLLAYLTKPQLENIPARRVKNLKIKELKPEQIAWLTLEQIGRLSADQLAALSHEQVRAFTRAQAEKLRPDQKSKLKETEAALLDLDFIRNMSTVRVARTSVENWKSFHSDQVQALTGDLVDSGRAFGTAQMQTFSGNQLRAIPFKRIKYVDLAALTHDQLSQFTAEQVRKFTPQQMAELSLEQLAAFTSSQSAVLRPHQTALLNADQLNALTHYTAPSRVRGVLGKVRARGIDSYVMTGTATGAFMVVWPALPDNVKAYASAAGFGVRGLGIITKEIFPKKTAPHKPLGRALRVLDVVTYLPNMADGIWKTYGDLSVGEHSWGQRAWEATDGATFNLANWWYSSKSLKEAMTGRNAFPHIDKLALPLYLIGSIQTTIKARLGHQDLSSITPDSIHVVPDALGTVPGGIDMISGVMFTAGSAYLGWKAFKPPKDSNAKFPRIADGVAFGGGLILFGLSTWAAFEDSQAKDDVQKKSGAEKPARTPEHDDDGTAAPPVREEHAQPVVATTQDRPEIDESRQVRQEFVSGGEDNQSTGVLAANATDVSAPQNASQIVFGRSNFELEHRGHSWVDARHGQSIGSIAREHAADVAKTVMLNMDHIPNPHLVSAGDRVYLP